MCLGIHDVELSSFSGVTCGCPCTLTIETSPSSIGQSSPKSRCPLAMLPLPERRSSKQVGTLALEALRSRVAEPADLAQGNNVEQQR